jgi:hypothetical protein
VYAADSQGESSIEFEAELDEKSGVERVDENQIDMENKLELHVAVDTESASEDIDLENKIAS